MVWGRMGVFPCVGSYLPCTVSRGSLVVSRVNIQAPVLYQLLFRWVSFGTIWGGGYKVSLGPGLNPKPKPTPGMFS